MHENIADEIKKRLECGSEDIANYPIFSRHDIDRTASLFKKGGVESFYIDVPLSAICGLHHANFASNYEGLTWRKAMLEGITGRQKNTNQITWTHEVIDYFEGEIFDKPFAGADSLKSNLRLSSYGGAVTSDNGVHRLIGAYCWIALKSELKNTLRKARLDVHGVDSDLGNKLLDIVQEKNVLFTFKQACKNSFLLERNIETLMGRPVAPSAFLVSSDSSVIWFIENNELIQIDIKWIFLRRLLGKYSLAQVQSAKELIKKLKYEASIKLNAEILRSILSNEWLNRSLREKITATNELKVSKEMTLNEYIEHKHNCSSSNLN